MMNNSAALVDECSEEQVKTLTRFSEELRELDNRLIGYDDTFFLRYLIANEWSLKKSQDTIAAYLEWRESSYLAYLMDNVPLLENEIAGYFSPGGPIGYSKLGHPVIVVPIGRTDIEGLRHSMPYMNMANQRLKIYKSIYERIQTATERVGRPVDQVYMIFDFKDAKLTSFVGDYRAFNTELGQYLVKFFPEIFAKLFFVNAKGIITKIFGFVQNFLTERVRTKIYVLGSQPGSVLLQYIDADVLPACYGGNREDPPGDPYCSNVIAWPKALDPSLYYGDILAKNDLSDFIDVKVARGSKEDLMVGKGKIGNTLKWTILSDRACIGFGIFYTLEDGSRNDILLPMRLNCHLIPEQGNYPIKEDGKYFIILDNTYSYVNSKTVYISLSLR